MRGVGGNMRQGRSAPLPQRIVTARGGIVQRQEIADALGLGQRLAVVLGGFAVRRHATGEHRD